MEPDRLARQEQKPRTHAQQQPCEDRRDHSAGHSQHRIDGKLRRADQVIFRDIEERIIAERYAQDHPGGCGGQHHAAHHGRVEVAHDLLQGKDHRGQRGIERGCNGRCRAHRNQLLGAEAQRASQHRTDSRAHLNRRPLASQGNPAGQRRRGAEELAQHGAQRDAAIARKERGLGLRHAAAARIGEEAVQQIADAERAHHREQETPPRRTLHRV